MARCDRCGEDAELDRQIRASMRAMIAAMGRVFDMLAEAGEARLAATGRAEAGKLIALLDLAERG